MNGVKRTSLILLGIALTLLGGELTLRAVSDLLPERSLWPSAATEVKAGQPERAGKFDVVFLGSSVTEAAVDPDLLAPLSVYNAALPFSSPISNEKWLTGIFPDLDGTIVVLGLPAWPFHGDEGSDELARQIQQALLDDRSAAIAFDLSVRKGVLADWFSLRSRELTVKSGAWTTRGHQTAYYARSGDSLVGRFPPFGRPMMSTDAESAIRRIAEWIEAGGGELVVMVEPGRYPGDVADSQVDAYIDYLRQLSAELGIIFWDTYGQEWDPLWFADEAHFNQLGTRAFSTYLGSLIEAQS